MLILVITDVPVARTDGTAARAIGLARGAVSNELYTALLAVVAVSIALSAVLVRAFPKPAGQSAPAG